MKKFLMAVAGVALMSATALADDDMFEVYPAGRNTTAKGTYGSFKAAWAACEDYGKIKICKANADAITIANRHVTLEVDSTVSYGHNITVGENAELSFDGRDEQGAITGTITITGTNSELFVDGGTVGKIVVRNGYALVNYTTVTTIEQHGGSLQVEYSTVDTLTADGDSSLTLGFGNTIKSPSIADTVKRDDYEWTEDTSAYAVRMSLNGGKWTSYKTFTLAVNTLSGKKTSTNVVIELLRNASMAKNFTTSIFAHNVDVTIRSNSDATKRYVLRRTGNYNFSANPNATTYTHKLRFENVVLDGGAKWTNPFFLTGSGSDELLADSSGLSIGQTYPILVCKNHPYVTFGNGSEIRNVKSYYAIQSDANQTYSLTFEDGFRLTSNRTKDENGQGVADIISMGTSANATLDVRGGRFDRNYAYYGSIFDVANTSSADGILFSNCKIKHNRTYGTEAYPFNLLSRLVLGNAEIVGNVSDSELTGTIYNDKCVTLSGHPIVRNNCYLKSDSYLVAGLYIAGSAVVDGVLDWGAYVETGGSMNNFTYTTGASGFDHIVSFDKTKVGAGANNKVSWTTPKLFVSVGESQTISGDIASGLLKFQFDGACNAGSCTVNGNLKSGTFSIGAPYDAVKRHQTRNFYVPLLTATSVDLSLLSVDVPLPEGWHLAKSTVQGGEELRLVYNPTGGLVIFVKP